MADEQAGRTTGGQHLVELLEHEGLDGDVQGGGRLVADHQVRGVDQRHREDHALPLATGELVREGVSDPGGVGEPHLRQHRHHLVPGRAGLRSLVQPEDLRDLASDTHGGVEGCHRFLEDHRNHVATKAGEGGFRGADDLGVAQPHRTGGQGVLRQQTHHRKCGDRLARARLPDQAQSLPRGDLEVDTAHGCHLPATEADSQVTHLQQAHEGSPRRCSAVRSGGEELRGVFMAPPATAGRGSHAGRRRAG